MPLQKLQFRPGLNREGTDYSNEGGWYDGDKVRFRSGFPEKIGGWTQVSPNQYKGIARSLWIWSDADAGAGTVYTGVGTNSKYYILSGGIYNDVTPIYHTSTLTGVAGTIATTNGSTTVTIKDAGYNPAVGDYVTITSTVAVNGVQFTGGDYQVISVPSSTTFTVTFATAASNTGSGTGGTVTLAYEYPSGLDVYATGTGWGAGPWSRGAWSSPYIVGTGQQLRLWSNDNFGADLVLAPRGGPIFYWTDSGGVSTRAKYLSTVANSTTVITDSAASVPNSGTTMTVSAAVAPYIYPYMPVDGNANIPAGTLVASSYITGSTTVPLTNTLTGSGTVTGATFSYAGAFVPSSTYQVISSAIQEFVIAFGANPYSPNDAATTFNPMLVRWSDQANPYQWVPSISNQSGEYALTNGSYIMNAKATRQEILVWTDSAIYSMQYLGAPYVWGFQILMDNITVMSPNSMVTINNVTYWMGRDRFYMYSGRVEVLPCALRQYIFADINEDQSYQIFAGANEAYNEVWWFYVSQSSGGTTIDKYIIYNYLDRVWYYGSMSRSAWMQSGSVQYPIAASVAAQAIFTGSISGNVLTVTDVTVGTLSVGQTITGFGVITGTTISALGTGTGNKGTYTINVAQVAESTKMVASVNTGVLLYHEVGCDDLSTAARLPIDSYVQSSDFDIGDGHNFGFVWRILPDVNFNGSTVNNPTVTMTVKPRQNSGTAYGQADNPQVVSAQNYTTIPEYTIQQFTGQVYTRLRGRQMAFRIESTGLGVAWQLGSPRIDIRPDGRR